MTPSLSPHCVGLGSDSDSCDEVAMGVSSRLSLDSLFFCRRDACLSYSLSSSSSRGCAHQLSKKAEVLTELPGEFGGVAGIVMRRFLDGRTPTSDASDSESSPSVSPKSPVIKHMF